MSALLKSLAGVGCLLLALVPMRAASRRAEGCAAVWGRTQRPVAIVAESAIILWDAPQKVQHFIRWARFDAAAPDFGFLVPTPTQPALAEVSESIFTKLEEWTAPKVVAKNEWNFEPMLCIFGCSMKAPMRDGSAGVRVLDRQIVGGLDAAVLEADDAEAVRQWLDQHGYSARPELTAWLAPYLADKWKITAFKIAKPAGDDAPVQTAPVRMSFRTERPFFPYREPAEPKETSNAYQGQRLLRVFFVGDQRMRGVVDDTPWSARVPWSNALDEARQAELAAAVGLARQSLPAGARLTVFEDPSSSRAGSQDVWFQAATTQEPIVPPDRIERYRIWIPGDLVLIGMGVLVIGFIVRARRRGGTPKFK